MNKSALSALENAADLMAASAHKKRPALFAPAALA
jgi:hypothetical protein